MSSRRSSCRAASLALAVFLASPLVARAQSCAADGPRPMVCELELWVSTDGERPYRLRAGERLAIPAGEEAVVEASARDQYGRPFPADRLLIGAELDRRCRGLVELDRDKQDRVLLAAGTERGSCDLVVWVPGNLNLELSLRLEVVSRARDGYSRGEAEHIAGRLFRAILGREADPGGLSGATAEIQRGRLNNQVEAMFRSEEFRRERAGLPPATLLEQIYDGLLGRAPDTGGVRTYLEQVARGRGSEVVLSIVRSEEFERQLVGKSLR